MPDKMVNRIAKATRYADAFEANGNTLDEVRCYTEPEWIGIGAALAEDPPSQETRALIIAFMRDRAQLRASDPFEGVAC